MVKLSAVQVPRASRFQQTQDAHLDEEDEDTGDHYDDHDLEMEDELEEEEDEEVMESADEEDGAEASEDSPGLALVFLPVDSLSVSLIFTTDFTA